MAPGVAFHPAAGGGSPPVLVVPGRAQIACGAEVQGGPELVLGVPWACADLQGSLVADLSDPGGEDGFLRGIGAIG